MPLICCSSRLLARRPVLKMAVVVPGQASANALTNMATAVVFPKRRGVIALPPIRDGKLVGRVAVGVT